MAEKPQDQDFIVTEALGKTEHFIDQNKKSLGIIIGALVLAVGGYLFYQKVYVAGKETDAQKELFRAEENFKNDSLKLAINGDGNHMGLEDIVNEYSVSPSGNLARYYLGMAYIKQKEYDKAIDMLKSYDAKDEVTGAIVLGAIGDAYMELKNTDEAITYYEKASKENPNNFDTPIMLMKWAAALESKGNYKEATEVYERLKKDYPSSPEGAQIDKYISRANTLAGN
ncbi:MAG TPA: tetratricopeptide repeat protein [Bacteroidia bacterium]|nr:tetratricopeptide repeat protein [Bacteroidia bacterium]